MSAGDINLHKISAKIRERGLLFARHYFLSEEIMVKLIQEIPKHGKENWSSYSVTLIHLEAILLSYELQSV